MKGHELYQTFLVQSFQNKLFIQPFIATIFILVTFFFISYLSNFSVFKVWGFESFTYSDYINRILIVWLLGNIISSISEEILFRGLILNYVFNKSKNLFLSILFSAFIFSIGHLHYQSFLNFSRAFVGGIVLGYYYITYKSIIGAISIHFAYNLFIHLLASDPGRGPVVPYLAEFDFTNISPFIGDWIEVFIIMALLTILLLFHFIKKIEILYK